MAYARFDDNYTDHPKVAALSDAAFRLHVAAVCYCARLLTDGLIDAGEVPRLVRAYKKSALKELIERRLLLPVTVEGDVAMYEVHDYLSHNDSRSMVLDRRSKACERQARGRAKAAAERGDNDAT